MKTKLNILILILFVFPSVIFSQTFKRISLEDLWLNYSFYPERAEDIVPMNDGEHYLILLDEYTIVRYSYKSSQAVDTLVTKEMLKPVDGQTAIQIESFEIKI